MNEMLNIKTGDSVVVKSKWNSDKICVVEKITPTGLIKVDGILYHVNGDEKTADIWNRSWIKIATDNDVKNIIQQNYIRRVLYNMSKCEELTYEQAFKINGILKEKK